MASPLADVLMRANPDDEQSAYPDWLLSAAMHAPGGPETTRALPDYMRRGPYRSMAAGRDVADWRSRDPEADMQETKNKWADIYNDPAGAFESVATPVTQIIGAALRHASPNPAQAAPLGGKSIKKDIAQSSPDVMEEQRALAAAGFYKDTPDGVDGPATKRARLEYGAAQDRVRERQLEERRLAIQEGQLVQGEKKNTADVLGAENEKTRLELLGKENEEKEARRKQGEAALRESEKNLSTWDKMMRSYGPTIGGILGTVGGIASRAGVKKLGDIYQKSQADKAEKVLEGAGGAVTRENLAARVGATNDWWRRGGAKNEPFVNTPQKTPGVAVNVDAAGIPLATPIKDMFTPGLITTKGADAAAMGAFGLGGIWAHGHLEEAKADFAKAQAAVNDAPTDVNIEAYQTAKSRLSSAEAKINSALSGIGTYGLTAMARPRYPIKPPTNVAESEKLGIETFLREQGTAAEKAAKAAATRQANAARKAEEAAAARAAPAEGASTVPLPANPMRKFDNHGNPINRGDEVEKSLKDTIVDAANAAEQKAAAKKKSKSVTLHSL